MASTDSTAQTVPTKRILVMDDDEDVLLVTALLLEKKGYSVTKAADGREALDQYAAQFSAGEPFHLVITDLSVPEGMGGVELLAHIRQIDSAAPVILMTGYSDDPELVAFGESEFAGLLHKPFNKKTLYETVDLAMA